MATNKELQAEIDALKSQLAAKPAQATVSCKVGEKGGVVICGLGNRFPTTLYYAQLHRLNEAMPGIMKWAEKNKHSLAMK